MQQYPSIPGASKSPIGEYCIAFYKYDGSNLRWEWSPKRGWNKFGTRRHLFDAATPIYNQAIPIFMDHLADEIVYRTRQLVKNPERITAFTEFFGPNSFAGAHEIDDPKELRLFDVFLFKKGLVPPKQFVKVYGDMPQAAEVIYEGNLSRQFVMDVREGKYPVIEGVIAKGDDFMVKIKTKAYFDRLFNQFGDDWEKYSE
jgi:hypothetical protein